MAAGIDTETLFAREAALREASINYADWIRNGAPKVDGDRKGIDESRKRLRAAAIAYADAARVLDK